MKDQTPIRKVQATVIGRNETSRTAPSFTDEISGAGVLAPNPSLVGRTSQQVSDAFYYERFGAKAWPPAVQLPFLATYYLEDADVFIAVNKIVNKVCGHGYLIEKDPTTATEVSDAEVMAARKRWAELSAERTFLGELRRVVTDYVLLGNAAMEVTRNGKGEVDSLYWMPATEMRVRVKFDGYVQRTAAGRYQMFNRYEPRAEVRQALAASGQWHRTLNARQASPRQDSKTQVRPDPDQPWANEVIAWTTPNPGSRYYGLPPLYPVLPDIVLKRSAKMSNLAFFRNGLMPDYALIVEGGDLSEQSVQAIEDYLADAHKGANNHHGILYIAALPELVGTSSSKVSIRLEPLQAKHTDMNWSELDLNCTTTILRSFQMTPSKGGLPSQGKLGGGTADREATDSFKHETVEPIQTEFEATFTRMLKEDLGFTGVRFRFGDLDMTEQRQNLDMASRAAGGRQILTVNEARQLVKHDRLDDDAHDTVPTERKDPLGTTPRETPLDPTRTPKGRGVDDEEDKG